MGERKGKGGQIEMAHEGREKLRQQYVLDAKGKKVK